MNQTNEKEIIYEENDFCEVCDCVQDVGRLYLPNPDITLRVCQKCYETTDFEKWFRDGLKNFLENSPDYEKLPNGKYIFVGEKK